MTALQSLHEQVAAVAPIHGVSRSGRIDFLPDASAEQRTAAQAVVDAFDWSDAAERARQDGRKPERATLRQQAAQAIEDLDAFLAIPSPNQAQTLAIVKKLCQQNKRIIARLIQVE